MKLLVLAGGFGTRLRSVVADVPKPLAPINNKPFLYYLLENWSALRFESIIFLLHHKAEQIRRFVLDLPRDFFNKTKIEFLIENQPLGTGGAVAFAVKELLLTGDFLVVNADTWLDLEDTQKLLTSSAPSLGIIQVPDTSRYGKVFFENNQVLQFQEKTENSGSGWINAGIYKLNHKFFEDWDGSSFSIETKLFPKLVQERKLNVSKLQGHFIDIGVPEDYSRYDLWIKSNRKSKL